ncbi:acyl-CoA synthetase [Actinomycetospora straminea]|nr:acyl-CoA synthetase [Actinomycetospora straminea]MDD7935353.1 acyl-CoA synthetase [Actinomycetospora straminea]
MTLLRALAEGALDDPDAIRVGDAAMSGPELLGAAAVVADQIRERSDEGPVAVLAEPTAQAVVAMVGGLLAGVPVVPVPPDTGPGERSHVITDSGASLWIGDRPHDVSLPMRKVDINRRSGDVAREAPNDGPALVLYTSGTTGAPKGVLLSRAAMGAGLDGLAEAWDWTARDTLAHGLPLFHVHGLVLGVFGALRIGSPLVHVGRPKPSAYAAAVRDHGATLLFGVPTIWSRIAADPQAAAALRPARLLVSGSAPLPVPVFEQLRELTGQAPVERYGMSETMITLSVRADGERRPGWVGVPVAGVETRLASTDEETAQDDGVQLLPHDGETIGELQLRGPGLFDGYLGRPEATAATWTTDRWFRTGDAAVIDEGGYHRIVGRRSVDLIKTGGYRVGAGEIETALLEHEGIREAAVVGEPDDDLGQRIVAHVVLVGDPVDPEEVIAFVADRLSAHKRPREVRVVDALPRNAMGKVQKARLS